MATKKPRTALGILSPSSPTRETTHARPPAAGPDVPTSPRKVSRTLTIGLLPSEIQALGDIAQRESVTRNNLAAYAIRRFLREYRAGKIDLAKDTKRRLV